MQRNDGIKVYIEQPVVLPNQVADDTKVTNETKLDSLPLPSQQILSEQRPAVGSTVENEYLKVIRNQVGADRGNANFLSHGLYNSDLLSFEPLSQLDDKTLDYQNAWEQAQAEDVSRRSSFQNQAQEPIETSPNMRPACVSDIKGINALNPGSTPNDVPCLDRVQSIKRNQSRRDVNKRPAFVEPEPARRPSQIHSRKSSNALIMQAILRQQEVKSAESFSPAVSPTTDKLTISGASSAITMSPMNSPTTSSARLSNSAFTLSGQNISVYHEQKPTAKKTSSGPCCVIL